MVEDITVFTPQVARESEMIERLKINLCAMVLLLLPAKMDAQQSPEYINCDCLSNPCVSFHDQDTSLTGTLHVENHTHGGNGQNMRPFVLRLDQQICVQGDGQREEDNLEWRSVPNLQRIQLSGDFQSAEVRRLVDTHVKAVERLFAAFSAWHVTDVLIDVKRDVKRIAAAPPLRIAE